MREIFNKYVDIIRRIDETINKAVAAKHEVMKLIANEIYEVVGRKIEKELNTEVKVKLNYLSDTLIEPLMCVLLPEGEDRKEFTRKVDNLLRQLDNYYWEYVYAMVLSKDEFEHYV